MTLTDIEKEQARRRYEILAIPDSSHYAILVRASSARGAHVKVLCPDVGDSGMATIIYDMLVSKEEERILNAKQEQQRWEDSLLEPHVYVQRGMTDRVCYCDATEDAEIHIPLEAKLISADKLL